MKKDSNSNKKKLKLRRIEEAKKVKRIKSRMAQARRVIIDAPKEPINKARVLKVSALIGLFFFLLIKQPSETAFAPVCEKINNSRGMCTSLSFDKLKNPYARYSAPLVKKKIASSVLHKNISSIIKNTPMEKMIDDISKRDDKTAAFIVGIAMKESKFGRYSPKKNGKECYNYWGYRGSENTTASGYSCFDNPKHAIKVVGDRIEKIVKKGANTPAKMISWKCGSSCAGHSPESVDKWISDVGINYYKIQDAVILARK